MFHFVRNFSITDLLEIRSKVSSMYTKKMSSCYIAEAVEKNDSLSMQKQTQNKSIFEYWSKQNSNKLHSRKLEINNQSVYIVSWKVVWKL